MEGNEPPEIVTAPSPPSPETPKAERTVDTVIANLETRPEYANSYLLDSLKAQREQINQGTWAFGDQFVTSFNDLDGTYTKPGNAHRTESLTQFIDNNGVARVAITGRDRTLVARGQQGGAKYEEEHLPMFHAEADEVGTVIWIAQKDGTYVKDTQWDTYIRDEVKFDRDNIYNSCVDLLATLPEDLATLKLEFQPRDRENNVKAYKEHTPEEAKALTGEQVPQDYKISFNFNGTQKDSDSIKEHFVKVLGKAGYDKVQIVISHDKAFADGTFRYNIDLVPVTKKDAINYMKKTYGTLTTVAGDSGNDEDMLLNSDAEVAFVPYGTKDELEKKIKGIKDLEGVQILKQTDHILQYRDKLGKVHLIFMQLEKYHGDDEDKGPKSVEYLMRGAQTMVYRFDRNGRKVEDE